jgi:hypothetical protein
LIALLLLGEALAHRPHDVVVAVAIPPDFDSSGRAVVVITPGEVPQPLLTTDFGQTWDERRPVFGEDDVVSGAWGSEGPVLLAADGTLWHGDADGNGWIAKERTGGAAGVELAVAGDRIAVTSAAGLLLGPVDAEDPLPVVASATGHVTFTREGTWAASAGSKVWTEGEGEIDALPAAVTGLAGSGGTLYAATLGGGFRWDGATWTKCAPLPEVADPALADHWGAVAIGADGEVLATSATEALFVSRDACETWEVVDVPLHTSFGGEGGAATTEEAWTGAWLTGDHGLVAGHDGLAWTEDGGATWTEAKLEPGDYTRGIAFGCGEDAGGHLLLGGYGGGASWTEDGGETWTGSAAGMGDDLYAYDVLPACPWPGSDVAVFSSNRVTYRTRDGGNSWEEVGTVVGSVTRYISWEGAFYAFGTLEGDAAVAISEDEGETWAALDAAAGTRSFFPAVLDGVPGLLGAGDTLRWSTDGGHSWEELADLEDGRIPGAATWPPEEGDRIVVAGPSGVQLSDDRGQSWRAPSDPPSATAFLLVADEAGRLFLTDRTNQLWSSEDGGETWIAGPTLEPGVVALTTGQGLLVAGTRAGVFWTADGDAWHELPNYERFEDGSYHLACDGCDREDVRGGSVFVMEAGDRLSFAFEGDEWRVVSPDGGDLPLDADDRVVGSWHFVELTATDRVRVDAIEAFGPGEPFPYERGEGRRCGCGKRDRSGLVLLLALAAIGGRRRRHELT